MPLYEVAAFVNDVEKVVAASTSVGRYFTVWVSKTLALDAHIDDYEAGEVPPKILIKDSFTDIYGTLLRDHMPEIGGAWSIPKKHPRILNNQLGMHIIGEGYGINAAASSIPTCYAKAVFRQITGVGTTFRLYLGCEVDSPLGGDFVRANSATISLNGVLINYARQDGDVFKIVKRVIPSTAKIDYLPLMGVH